VSVPVCADKASASGEQGLGAGSLTLDALLEHNEDDDEDEPLQKSNSSVAGRIQSAVEQDQEYCAHQSAECGQQEERAGEEPAHKPTAARKSVFPEAKNVVKAPVVELHMAAQDLVLGEVVRTRPRLILENAPPVDEKEEHVESDPVPAEAENTAEVEVEEEVTAAPTISITKEVEIVKQSIVVESKPEPAAKPIEQHVKANMAPVVVVAPKVAPVVEVLPVQTVLPRDEDIGKVAPAPQTSPARSTEEYQTATQALEKKMFFKSTDDDAQSVSSHNPHVSHRDISNALKVPSPRAPVNPDPKIPVRAVICIYVQRSANQAFHGRRMT
jgi:hypothetical protein